MEDFLIPEPGRHWGCRVNDQIVWQGMRAILLQNDLLQIVLLPEKGAEIIQFLYKPLDVDFLWRAPNRLTDPAHFVPTGGSAITPFFDRWSGGWFEVVPNGGPGCEVNGASFGFFAETINVPWQYRILQDDAECVSIGLWVRTHRTPFLLKKTLTLRLGQPVLSIQEQLVNEGHEPVSFMWGHHPVMGAPFLDETCRLYAPPSTVEVLHAEDGPDHRMGLHQQGKWPHILDRDGRVMDLRELPPSSTRSMDNCYLYDFPQGWIAVANPGRQVGFGLAWDERVFRYVWIWQALGGGIGYPWYGRTYSMGIEPWSSYPCAGLAEAIGRGTALTLDAGESLEAWLSAVAFTGAGAVEGIDRDGTVHFEGR